MRRLAPPLLDTQSKYRLEHSLFDSTDCTTTVAASDGVTLVCHLMFLLEPFSTVRLLASCLGESGAFVSKAASSRHRIFLLP